MRRASRVTASSTGPPNMPECTACSSTATSTTQSTRPRSDVVRAGTPDRPVGGVGDDDDVGARAGRGGCAGTRRNVGEPISSSPSTKTVTPTGRSAPRQAERAQGAHVRHHARLVVRGAAAVEPLRHARWARTGGLSQSAASPGGCTSWCAYRSTVGAPSGAGRRRRRRAHPRPTGRGTGSGRRAGPRRAAAPRRRRRSRRRAPGRTRRWRRSGCGRAPRGRPAGRGTSAARARGGPSVSSGGRDEDGDGVGQRGTCPLARLPWRGVLPQQDRPRPVTPVGDSPDEVTAASDAAGDAARAARRRSARSPRPRTSARWSRTTGRQRQGRARSAQGAARHRVPGDADRRRAQHAGQGPGPGAPVHARLGRRPLEPRRVLPAGRGRLPRRIRSSCAVPAFGVFAMLACTRT